MKEIFRDKSVAIMKRANKKESKPEDVDVDDVESEEEEPQEEVKPKKKSQKKSRANPDAPEKEEKKGYNWGAIAIMLMFAIPMLITGTMQVREINHVKFLLFLICLSLIGD